MFYDWFVTYYVLIRNLFGTEIAGADEMEQFIKIILK